MLTQKGEGTTNMLAKNYYLYARQCFECQITLCGIYNRFKFRQDHNVGFVSVEGMFPRSPTGDLTEYQAFIKSEVG
jgi:hypothetical protein